MKKSPWLIIAAAGAACAVVAYAQYPIMDAVANKVIQRYQSSTCEDLWAKKGQHGPEEQRVIGFLKSDPQMRKAFFDKISGPVVNKMFDCGMVP